jgi:hypothetical protein
MKGSVTSEFQVPTVFSVQSIIRFDKKKEKYILEVQEQLKTKY